MSKVPVGSSLEVQQSFREVWGSLDPFLRTNINLSGRRFINAGNARSGSDFVTQQQVADKFGFEAFYDELKKRGLDGFPGRLSDPQEAVAAAYPDPPPTTHAIGQIYYDPVSEELKIVTESGIVVIASGSPLTAESGSGNVARLDGTDTFTGNRNINAQWTFQNSLVLIHNTAEDGNVGLALKNDAAEYRLLVMGSQSDRLFIQNFTTDSLLIGVTATGTVYPYVNQGPSLGGAGNQWAHVHTKDLTVGGVSSFSGNITVSNTAPRLTLEDTTVSALDAYLQMQSDIFQINVGGNSNMGCGSTYTSLYQEASIAGSGKKLGFFAAARVSKQTVTGSREGNAALASLLTALHNHGLLVNSSTAGNLGFFDSIRCNVFQSSVANAEFAFYNSSYLYKGTLIQVTNNDDAGVTAGEDTRYRGALWARADRYVSNYRAGVLMLEAEDGTNLYLWLSTESPKKLRMSLSDPGTNDTAGTVVATF